MELQLFVLLMVINKNSALFEFGKTDPANACKGSDADLVFGYRTDDEVSLIEWYYNATKTPVLMAQYVLGEKPKFSSMGSYLDRVFKSSENNAAIKLKSVTMMDEGKYFCVAHVKDQLYNSSVGLRVTKPPSEEPFIKFITRTDGSKAVKCRLLGDRGTPPVGLHLEDEHGFPQSAEEITISDDQYKCCMKGIAVKCFQNGGKERFCVQKESELSSTWSQSTCILISTLYSLALCIVTFLGWCCVILYVKTYKAREAGTLSNMMYLFTISSEIPVPLTFWKKDTKIPTSIKTSLIIWIFAQIMNLIVSLPFCISKKDLVMLFIGMACWLGCVVISVFMSIAYKITDEDKKEEKQRKDGNRSDRDSGFSLTQSSESVGPTETDKKTTVVKRGGRGTKESTPLVEQGIGSQSSAEV